MLSATANTRTIDYAMPPEVMASPQAAEAWLRSLPADARASFEAKMRGIVKSLPPAMKLAASRYLVAAGEKVPEEVGVGQWAALATGLVQAGTGLYSSYQTNSLQKELASNALANDRAIALASQKAAEATQLALIDAQREAAQVAAAASVARADLYTSPKVLLSVGGLALVGLGLWFFSRRKKK